MEKKATHAVAWASGYCADQKSREVAARLVRLLEAQINVPVSRFPTQTRFLDDWGMDDLEPVEVLLAIEEEFKIPEFSNDEAQKMLTIDDVVQYLGAHAATAGRLLPIANER